MRRDASCFALQAPVLMYIHARCTRLVYFTKIQPSSRFHFEPKQAPELLMDGCCLSIFSSMHAALECPGAAVNEFDR